MTKRLVLIDDSPSLLKQLASFLENTPGFRIVATGSDGRDALKLYREHKPDLLTMDLTMPHMDGRTALLEIMREFPDARVMIISAIRGQEMTLCLKAGAKAYVEKPLRLKDELFLKEFRASLAEALG